jgi:4'-phosphopantetheinyl transferase
MPDATLHWPLPPPELRLEENEVHIFAAPLDLPQPELEKRVATLSLAEKERAGKFKFDKHRNRFIAGRGLLREALAHYLQTEPIALDFSYSERGKPEFPPHFPKTGIYFNLAHSENLALLAITRIGSIGVDVEHIRPVNNVEELVARFFSKREDELFQKLSDPEKPAAFFNLWTRKEALLKATGEGIGNRLNQVEVSFLAGESAKLLAISGDTAKAAQWTLQELLPTPGFVGALAIESQNLRVSCWTWK